MDVVYQVLSPVNPPDNPKTYPQPTIPSIPALTAAQFIKSSSHNINPRTMAAHTPNTKASKKSLTSNEIPINSLVAHSTSKLNVHTPCNKSIDNVKSLPENDNRELRLQYHVRTRREKEKIKELAAFENNREDQPSGPLTIRNAIPASQLLKPRRATAEEKEIQKKNFREEIARNQPYVITDALLEDQKLP